MDLYLHKLYKLRMNRLKMTKTYPIYIIREASSFSVCFPDLNDLATCGESLEEAMEMGKDCLAGYLYSLKRSSENVPAPSSLDSLDTSRFARENRLEPEDISKDIISVDVASYAKAHFE